ncbi:hypothetical protein QUA54_18905 [Microcoleus sp. MOSTC5]|uniref:hypothetical protein n=1 Tax=Microcoleus TaxID=44471 RepID=UPI00155422A7|nr:hypothetical protein [Microcoleus asticus]
MNQSLQRWHSRLLLGTAGLQAIALELLKLLKLPMMMMLGEFWCLQGIGQEWNQYFSIHIL